MSSHPSGGEVNKSRFHPPVDRSRADTGKHCCRRLWPPSVARITEHRTFAAFTLLSGIQQKKRQHREQDFVER